MTGGQCTHLRSLATFRVQACDAAVVVTDDHLVQAGGCRVQQPRARARRGPHLHGARCGRHDVWNNHQAPMDCGVVCPIQQGPEHVVAEYSMWPYILADPPVH